LALEFFLVQEAEEQQQLLSDPNPTTSNAQGSPDVWLQYEIEDTGIGALFSTCTFFSLVVE
jgi:hypothetical protein